ncbi:MAG: ABC transporter permease [Candidatus Saccharimonadales bacterium]
MTLASYIREGMNSLRSTRVRTGLTTLGIIIGVLSITLVMSLGEGAKRTIANQITGLDSGIIVAKPGGADQRAALTSYNPFAIASTSTLTERDLRSINDLKATDAASPLMFINGSVKYNDRTATDAPIIATTPEFADLLKLKLASGQFVSTETNRNTVVLGHEAALDILGNDQVRGQVVMVKGRPHTVIGVLKPTLAPVNAIGVNLDRSAFINLDDGKSFNQGIAQIGQLIMRASNPTTTAQTAAAIDKLLINNHDGERDFSVIEGKDIASNTNAFYSVIVLITAAVAVVALVVGGIGIMNIMLVSVTERTREVGIRKALGASDRHIFGQFLIEALTMTVVGGIIGLISAYIIAFFVATFFSFQPALTWEIVAIAMGLALSVGVIFGLYPAIKASRKDPIEALRQYE